jgi:hypothetical protein
MEYKILALWVLIGFFIGVRTKAKRQGLLTIDDIIVAGLFSFFGPLHLLILLIEFLAEHRNKVIWKSKETKIKEILYSAPPKNLTNTSSGFGEDEDE